jgi:hypothetical protein
MKIKRVLKIGEKQHKGKAGALCMLRLLLRKLRSALCWVAKSNPFASHAICADSVTDKRFALGHGKRYLL